MSTIRPEQGRSEFFTQDGDGVTYNANLDFSDGTGIGATNFEIGPPAGEIWICRRLIVYVEDAGQMNPSEYGDTGAELTNGINVQIVDGEDSILRNFTEIHNITSNGSWAERCFDSVNIGAATTGSDAYTARWTFANDNGGKDYRLIGDLGHKFRIILNDDLSGLTEHTFRLGCYAE